MNLVKGQVVELLESLDGFFNVPRPGLDLKHTLVANAERARLEAERRFGVSLSADELGVKRLSHLLSTMHETAKPTWLARVLGFKIPFRSSVIVANTFGALLGEALRQRVGGEWRLIDFENQRLTALWFDDRNWCLPTYKAGKHFQNGPEDDVLFFYQMIVERRSGGGLKDALVITRADIDKGQEHLMNMLSRHEQMKKDKANKKVKE